ncbi:hypothetical protein CAEBREN_09411 [Caenorhabditis brenneri]|uniref:Uncharacterized protein n=1 Tax=Caenorhabditis brenneri TaxID=135651 RepID=G0MXC1_CAEBE|nr:hypothetical protein CAEBREN_09411 [Caenorhabditis brenneri]
MEQTSSNKYKLSVELMDTYRKTSEQLIRNMERHNDKFKKTELIIYENAKKIVQAVIGKLEIVIAFGPCEFEWMDEVHKAILDYNNCTDKYEDIVHEISLLPKPNN